MSTAIATTQRCTEDELVEMKLEAAFMGLYDPDTDTISIDLKDAEEKGIVEYKKPDTDDEEMDDGSTSGNATPTQPTSPTPTQPQPQPQKSATATNKESLMRDVVDAYLAQMDGAITLPELMDKQSGLAYKIHDTILSEYMMAREVANASLPKGNTIPPMHQLPGWIAARVVVATNAVRVMLTGSAGHRIIMKKFYKNKYTNYQYKWAGYWQEVKEDNEEGALLRVFRLMCPSGTKADKEAYLSGLRDAGTTIATQDKCLVFFRNGVWDFRRHCFTAYDDPNYDEQYPSQITLRKLPVYHPYGDLSPIAVNPDGTCDEPTITMPDGKTWHPMQMMTDPFDMKSAVGKASQTILLQAFQMLLRKTNSDFGYYHFWINANGNGKNGKSSIWSMMKRMIEKPMTEGDEDLDHSGGTVIPLAVDNLDADYVLAQNILTAYAIVGEESDGSVTYIDRCSIAKMLARKQEMTFRVIREAPFSFAFDGFLLQHSNKAPIFNEKNDSVISHTIVIPFEKTFSNTRPYIKNDYVLREEVASWWAYYLTVEMDMVSEYDEQALKVLEPYRKSMLRESMNTFQFLDDAMPGLPLSVMPAEMLYSLYTRWCDLNGIGGRAVVNFNTFQQDMEQYGINNDHGVTFTRARKRVDEDEIAKTWCPALFDYGTSKQHGDTEWRLSSLEAYHNSGNSNAIHDHRGWLNPQMFITTGKDGQQKARRQFGKGCLVRQIPYTDMNYDVNSVGYTKASDTDTKEQ